MFEDNPIPRIPEFMARPVALLPKWPLQALLGHLGKHMAARHPGIFARLGSHAEKRFLIAPTDLPFAFLICPARTDRRIAIVDPDTEDWDSRIMGSFAALLGLVHGVYDGDGLFFSRDLTVGGDVEAVLALRNALDNEELDLFAELTTGLGAPGRLAAHALRAPARSIAKVTGIALVRTGEVR